ncbi:unnamed protein product [Urochloa humidicola]
MASVLAAASTGILLLLFSAIPAGAGGAPARPACDATGRGDLINLLCVGASRTSGCCSYLLRAVDNRGLRCLCQAAATPLVARSGHTVADVLGWYSDCGGRRPVNVTDLASTCSDDRIVAPGNVIHRVHHRRVPEMDRGFGQLLPSDLSMTRREHTKS